MWFALCVCVCVCVCIHVYLCVAYALGDAATAFLNIPGVITALSPLARQRIIGNNELFQSHTHTHTHTHTNTPHPQHQLFISRCMQTKLPSCASSDYQLLLLLILLLLLLTTLDSSNCLIISSFHVLLSPSLSPTTFFLSHCPPVSSFSFLSPKLFSLSFLSATLSFLLLSATTSLPLLCPLHPPMSLAPLFFPLHPCYVLTMRPHSSASDLRHRFSHSPPLVNPTFLLLFGSSSSLFSSAIHLITTTHPLHQIHPDWLADTV